MEKNKKKIIIIICIVIILILIDQITKVYAIDSFKEKILEILPNILNFNYAENRGGAFGIGQNGAITFIISNIIVLGLIVRFVILQIERIDKKTMIIVSLVLAGGISNLIDRLFRGFVVDFLQIFPNSNFPIFNLADCFIVIGWILLALLFAIHTWKDKRTKDNNINKVDSKVE